ncbi:MAG: TolC family protein [Proteobacteria bacterium]|jgi:outer membrane protein TolC|nr:TolC family protein [Pseudomonadota bacterium]
MRQRLLATAGTLAVLAGCASYQPKPLDLHPGMLDSVPHVTIDTSRLALPELRAHPFDATHGLDMTDVAILAVANNPDLVLARDDAHIARAQAFAAGLLPDPQFSSEFDQPGPKVAGSDTMAFNLGLSFDVGSLVYGPVKRRSAEAAARQTDLNLLWQEWQVVAQARVLFAQSLSGTRLLAVLEANRRLLEERYDHTQSALAKGLTTADVAIADLTALAGVESQIHDAQNAATKARSDLDALLNLSPSVKLDLVGSAQLPPLDDAKVRAILPELPARRPDLLALKAGYESQDETYRAAILQQFPDITIGMNRQRDTSRIYSTGTLVSFSIPMFDRNRGNIAVALATRQRLHDDFESRLNAAYRNIEVILQNEPLQQRQLAESREALAKLKAAAADADAAFRAGNLDELGYINLRSGVLAKEVEIIRLEETILEQNIALQTMIGSELPVRPVDTSAGAKS